MVEDATRVDNVVVVLMDSLNRHMLGVYGGREFATPNLDRFAALRFNRHYTGSLPCMPARHDLLCGALDFLWKPWGSIELWERPLTALLRSVGVTTKLVTDHPHLFETGGENYHVDFTAWDYQRGHESDPWRTRPDPSAFGAPTFGRGEMPYHHSRPWFRGEADFPGPRTMTAAARWLREEAPSADRFFLLVDEFDPHEPFDTPEPYASMYDDRWEGPHLIWPPYITDDGSLSAEQRRQIRAQYGAKLTMIDHWFGGLLEAIDTSHTAVIVMTDHGHYLGEKHIWGKPAVPVYQPLGHIPLLVSWPGVEPREVDALTTTVDVFATIADVFGVAAGHRTHGHSLVPVIEGRSTAVREFALSGVWGREVHVTDGVHKYVRGPDGDNAPLSLWSNRWSTMPVHRFPDLRLPDPDGRAVLDRMPGSTIPVIRQPFAVGDPLPYWALAQFDGHHLYDVVEDPSEDHDLVGSAREKAFVDMLRAALEEVEAPSDQFDRLGIA